MQRIIRSIVAGNWWDLVPECGIAGGFWLFGEVLILLISRLKQEPLLEMLPVPPVLALVAGAFMMLFIAVGRFSYEYDILLRFPVSRRAALAGQVLVVLLHGAILELAVAALALVGGTLLTLLYAAPGVFTTGLRFIPWWGWLLAWLLPPLLALTAGGVISRFGARGGWVLYFLFMASMISGTRFFDVISGLPTPMIQVIRAALIGLMVVLPLFGIHWLLKKAVAA